MAKKFRNILIIGATGLVGQAVKFELDNRNYKYMEPSSEEFDITDQEQMLEFFRHSWPDLVINCAGSTDVDENDSDSDFWPELINKYGPIVLCGLCTDMGVPLVHFSSSYVFDGTASEPYSETSPARPINRYGYYKFEAEKIMSRECPNSLIVRSSWVFGPGRTNFVSLVARKAQEKEPIDAPKELVSSPTYSFDLASATIDLIEADAKGLVNVVNEGRVSRYELAKLVLELVKLKGTVNPTPAEFAYRTKRPAFTVLNTKKLNEIYGIKMRPWREALEEYIHDYLHSDILLPDDILGASEI